MSRNEDVTTSIWVDLMDLTANAKLLYLWSFTNEHNGMSGLYKIHEAIVSVETGLRRDELSAALRELSDARFLFYVDGVLFVRSRVKKLRTRTSQIAKSIAKDVSQIRVDHPMRVKFLDTYGSERWLRDALAGVLPVNVSQTSGEVHENPHNNGGSLNLSRTSVEVPLSGQGLSSSEQDETTEGKSNLGKEVSELFAYWQQRCGHGHAKLTPERRRAIEGRRRQGYTVEQIRKAIDGAALAAHVNERGKRFDDIELICRNGSKLENFMDRAAPAAAGGVEDSAAYLARRGAAA